MIRVMEPTFDASQPVPVGEARSNFTALVNHVEILGCGFVIVRRKTPAAALVPLKLWEAVQAAGGTEAAIALLTPPPRAAPIQSSTSEGV
jgi:hypothetical protein